MRVTALLCFDDADLPMWGDLEMRGVRLLGPRGAAASCCAALEH